MSSYFTCTHTSNEYKEGGEDRKTNAQTGEILNYIYGMHSLLSRGMLGIFPEVVRELGSQVNDYLNQ